jgi:hypothetical protein
MGRRPCQLEGCSKGALGSTGYCAAHGGGKQCQHDGCLKSARGDTGHCTAHGGGRRCQEEGCSKSAVAGGTKLHCARRWQALPARGLPQVRSRRHAELHRAWGRQALSARGLHQVSRSSSRQHALHAMPAGHIAAASRRGGSNSQHTTWHSACSGWWRTSR